MRALPIAFTERMRKQLGAEEAESLFAALDTASSVAVRLNPAKCGEGEGVWSEGEAIAWSRYGRKLKERPSFTLDTAFHAGVYYVQEAASQFIDYIVAHEELQGKRVLDMCSAPGGKTTIYSTAVGADGLVLANEYVRMRANVLADNVRKWGLGNVLVTNNAPEHIAQFEGWFDLVAVDAPCSGEGMFRKEEVAREDWSEEAVKMCAARQTSILREAWQSLKEGGLLIYSTCTFNEEEDEGVLRNFIAEVGDDALEPSQRVEMDDKWGIVRGEVGAFQTFRFFPHKTDSEGLFVAIARKMEPTPQRTPKARKRVMQDVDKVVDIARRYDLHIVGLHEHTGSGLQHTESVFQSMKNLMALATRERFPELEFMDFGGGFKVPYKPDEIQVDYAAMGAEIVRLFKDFCRRYGKDLELKFEPGKYIVAHAGVMLTAVNTLKFNRTRTIAGCDAGFPQLIRPVFYGAYHQIENLSNPAGEVKVYDVCGNICESGDRFAEQRELPEIREYDVLAIYNAGAYCYSMGGVYNLRSMPGEVVIRNGECKLTRKRLTNQELINNLLAESLV